MAIVTFWSNGREQTGKTLSMVAISTYMAIEHNMKILLVSTANNNNVLHNCYFDKQTSKKTTFGFFAPRSSEIAMQSGMEGLIRIARSNKISAENIKDYTKVVFKDTLEILFSGKEEGNTDNVSQYYPEIVKTANQYYDLIFVDLDANIDEDIQREMMRNSNLVVANINQRLACVDNFKNERQHDEILGSKKTIVLAGRYDKFSRYTAKNISRYLGEKHVITVPYNTLFFDSAEVGQVPDMFFEFAKNKNLDREDRNYVFFQEISRAAEIIQYKIQELEMNK